MEWAYDKKKAKVVNASEVRKASWDRYRYTCPCCGEELIFVPEGKRRAYFKHLSGNNGHDYCEIYIPMKY